MHTHRQYISTLSGVSFYFVSTCLLCNTACTHQVFLIGCHCSDQTLFCMYTACMSQFNSHTVLSFYTLCLTELFHYSMSLMYTSSLTDCLHPVTVCALHLDTQSIYQYSRWSNTFVITALPLFVSQLA